MKTSIFRNFRFLSVLLFLSLISCLHAAGNGENRGKNSKSCPVVLEDEDFSLQEYCRELPEVDDEDSPDAFFDENGADNAGAVLGNCLRPFPLLSIVSVTAAGNPLRVMVRFDRSPEKKAAGNVANYVIDGGAITVKKAVPDGCKVRLDLNAPLSGDSVHTLAVKNFAVWRGHALVLEETFDYVDIPSEPSLWFRSDRKVVMDKRGRVFSWLDQSGNGYVLHSIPARKGKMPVYLEDAVNSLPSLAFERSLMVLPRVCELETDAISWFIVFKDNAPNAEQTVISNSYARSAGKNSKDLWGVRVGDGAVMPYSRTSQGELADTSHALDAEWHFLSCVWDESDRISSLTDSEELQFSDEIADASPKKHLFFNLGARLMGGKRFFSGEVAEIVVYASGLSAADRTKVENYLSLKYLDNSDSDRDGLPDEWEMKYFGNLNQNATDDPDGDGLTNLEEFKAGTDPTKADTDGDGISDADELRLGLDPLKADQDNDGLMDGWEIKYFGNLNQTAEGDPDADGVNNLTEFKQGRHPNAGAKSDTENKLKLDVLLPLR